MLSITLIQITVLLLSENVVLNLHLASLNYIWHSKGNDKSNCYLFERKINYISNFSLYISLFLVIYIAKNKHFKDQNRYLPISYLFHLMCITSIYFTTSSSQLSDNIELTRF